MQICDDRKKCQIYYGGANSNARRAHDKNFFLQSVIRHTKKFPTRHRYVLQIV